MLEKMLQGKKGLVMGIANHNSIAWNIATELHKAGAELALTYQADNLESRILPLAEQIDCKTIIKCNVAEEESVQNLFTTLKEKWGKLDFIIHAIAFSDKDELKGRYIDTSLQNFLNSMHISCYSLTSLAKHAEPLMHEGGSILTLTYYGAEKVIKNYNVMGVAKSALEASVRYLAADMGPNNIRVNAISAGPIKTLAASAIGDFRTMLKSHAETAPLKRNTSTQDVANAALYLVSNLSSGVTGEIHYVDSGYNIMGSGNM